jgi:beta-xylosidase
VATQPVAIPVTSDEFDDGFHLGWQWMANPMADWVDPSAKGRLRLKAVSSSANLWEAGHLLTQKLPGMAFTATTSVELKPGAQVGERAGIVAYGYDYAWIGLENTAAGQRLVQVTRLKADMGVNGGRIQPSAETVLTAPVEVNGPVHVRLSFSPVVVAEPAPDMSAPNAMPYWHSMLRSTHAKVAFSYSLDGVNFLPIGPAFTTQPGRWVGTQVGLFAQAPGGTPSNTATRAGYADFDYFRFGQ